MPTHRPALPAAFPSFGLGLAIRVYELLWHLALPMVLAMLWRRGAKEPLYRRFWGERFGALRCTLQRPVWVHSASMGEMRGAAPWVHALLAQGVPVLLSTLTPAGRQTADRLFAEAMRQGQLQLAYAPLELSWVVRRWLRRGRARCAGNPERLRGYRRHPRSAPATPPSPGPFSRCKRPRAPRVA